MVKVIEGMALGVLFYWPSERTAEGLAWSMACSIIAGFGIDYLWEK